MFHGCPPARWTPPLSEDFTSAIDKFLPLLRVVWRIALGFEHDAWQIDVIRCVFEINPATGHLRWRQFLISMARQQGKSEIAAALAILMLLWVPYALVIGIASSADQARIVYQRVLRVIRSAPRFAKLFKKSTDTRGIERDKGGGLYEIKAAKSAALQGLPVNLAVVDEVHIVAMALWTDLVNGTGSRFDCLVCGITTAGDEDSELLIHLYGEGDAGRIGFICWEAPDRPEYAALKLPEDDDDLWEDLCAAGPAYATGRVPRENVLADVRTMPPVDVIRYRLNRFVKGGELLYLPLALWTPRALPERPPVPGPGRVVFTLDRTPEWSYATITANWKDTEADLIHTEVVASYAYPSQELLVEKCAQLAKHGPRAYTMDSQQFGGLAKELKKRGMEVYTASLTDVVAACSLTYSKVAKGRMAHAGDPLLTMQLPRTKRKNSGEGYKLVRTEGQIDSVVATVLGTYYAEILPPIAPQLFV
jgi:hypothetical protein